MLKTREEMLCDFIHGDGDADSWIDRFNLSRALDLPEEEIDALMFVYDLEWQMIPDGVRADLGLESRKGASRDTVMKLCTVIAFLGLNR